MQLRYNHGTSFWCWLLGSQDMRKRGGASSSLDESHAPTQALLMLKLLESWTDSCDGMSTCLLRMYVDLTDGLTVVKT